MLLLRNLEDFHPRPSFLDLPRFNRDPYRALVHRHHRSSIVFEVLARRRADLGRSIITQLPADFLTENHGKYAAVGLQSRSIVVISDTMNELGRLMRQKGIAEPCYITRIGFSSVARIQ